MDSGNSGSMQSSSGGDEEYDSRPADSYSAFLNANPPSHVAHLPNPPPPSQPPLQQHHHPAHSSPSLFDPLSNYNFDPLSSRSPLSSNPNSLLNIDMLNWSKTLRSDPNCTDLGGGGGFMPSPSPTQQFLSNNQNRPFSSSAQITTTSDNTLKVSTLSGPNSNTNDPTRSTNNNNVMARNLKKRSRASRRAPTTVLTTDTANFRAMVQEFTGIPSPPFTSSSFPRSRLDLFGTASSLRSALDQTQPPPPYLLRPFAQKLQPPQFLSPPLSANSSTFVSSSMVDAIASTTTTTNLTTGSAASTNTSNSTPINYDLGLLKQPQNLLNMNVQNPILNFQSLFQATPKYPLSNSPILGTKPQGSLEIASSDANLKMGRMEDFGLGHDQVAATNLGGLQNMVSSGGTLAPPQGNESRSHHHANWGEGGGSRDNNHQGLLRSINGNNYNDLPRINNGKVNFLASSSDFHGDKGPENVAARSEGMVESWICSSD